MKPHLIRSLWSRPAWPASRIVSYEIVNSSKTVRNCYHVRQFHHSPRSGIVKPYLLADIGEGITEYQIIDWFVKPGDRVEQFDRICEVQSDKASVEITSRFDGTIKALHYATNDMAVVGQPLLDIDLEAEPSGEDEFPSTLITGDAIERIAKEDPQQMGSIGTDSIVFDMQKPPELHPPPTSRHSSALNQGALVTPAVRHMLKKLNREVSSVQGTGKNGRVSKEDVQRHVFSNASLEAKPAVSAKQAEVQDHVVALTTIENQMFKVMTRSLSIPQFLYTHAVDFTALNNFRRQINNNRTFLSLPNQSDIAGTKVTLLAIIMKAVSQVFNIFPAMNSHLDIDTSPGKPQLLRKGSHNFGIAVDTPHGLLVPVIRDVQSLSVLSLAAEVKRLSSLARKGHLKVDDLTGATFVISNVGSIGGLAINPIVVAPMVGILGLGKVQEVPVFQTNEYGVEQIGKREEVILSWSADHRVLDGATVARIAEALGQVIQNPIMLAAILK